MTTPYDVEDYPYAVIPPSHPARLGAIARLLGAPCVPFERCRVLEIGGGDGLNLVNMAVAAPDSTFVNFDLSQKAIARGRGLVSALGLTNLRLEAMDILDAGAELGEFDYVIAHGVYSWVPPTVRDRLMRLIGEVLAPDGVAMVSWMVLPGRRLRSAVRDVVRSAAASSRTPAEKIAAARDALVFHRDRWKTDTPDQAALRAEAEAMLRKTPSVLFHDELSDEWHPRLLSDVVAEARARGLELLGDARADRLGPTLFPDALTRETAARVGEDYAALEQARDFLEARSFRISLFTRGGAPADRSFDAARLDGLWVAGDLLRVAAEKQGEPDEWRAADGVRFAANDATLEAMLAKVAAAWPRSLPVDELAPDAPRREMLARAFVAGALDLTTVPPALASRPGERSRASRVARAQIAAGAINVATLRHMGLNLADEGARRFLALLDGSRAREDLVGEVRAWGLRRAEARAKVDSGLAALARMGLIEA